jgi:hypothetical protein
MARTCDWIMLSLIRFLPFRWSLAVAMPLIQNAIASVLLLLQERYIPFIGTVSPAFQFGSFLFFN